MTSSDRYAELRRELDIGAFVRQAREQSGLVDFGDETFMESLAKMLECFARDANFHAEGLAEFQEETVRQLVNRLRFVRDVRRHPEILDEDVSDPIIIIGLPRSGTTKSQRMMSADPNLLKTYTWQLVNQAPLPGTVPGGEDPRVAAAAAGDSLYSKDSPEVRAAHLMTAEQVEEDWGLFSLEFNDWHSFMRNPSRSWHDWVMSRKSPPDIGNYLFARRMFQYLQWQQGGRRNRRWLMKSCGHLANMAELLEAFPNATIFHAHRHPAASIPSFAKIILDVGGLRIADLEPRFIGEMVTEWARISIERYLETRDRLGLDGRIFDVSYDQIRSDPMPVFREAYRRAGFEFTAEGERAMLQWERDNEEGKHGKHVYSLERFGLDEKAIDDAFGPYIRRFFGTNG